MKNVTITLDDDIHRLARIRAAEMGTSLSALVKAYLTELVDGPPVAAQGVREMPLPFNAAPLASAMPVPLAGQPINGPEGQPYCVNGKWTFTKDGKPRKPGAMRHLGGGWSEDFDTWPDGFLDAMYGEDAPASDTWWLTANDVLKKPKDQ